MTEDALFEVYQSARASGQDGQDALAALFPQVRQHAEKVIWLTMHEHTPELAADIANEILHDIDKFRGDAKFSTWVHAVTRNVCCDEIRKRKREVSLESLELDTVADSAKDVTYDRIFLNEILSELTPDEQDLLVGRLHGETHREIATRMGLNGTCIRTRWEELTKKLRRAYGEEALLLPGPDGVGGA